jgi:diketogulonate reductase-like aldo/keto reductase
MNAYSDLRMTRVPLNQGAGQMPALGFGKLIPDAAETITATRDALEAGFRHFDCAERYGNEREVGRALHAGLAAGGIAREDIFVTTKLWNSNHRPERVEPAFEASLDRLGLKYLDATFRTPPEPGTAAGREAMFRLWIEGGFGSKRFGRLRCVVTHANLQPAVTDYVCRPGDSTWRAWRCVFFESRTA